MVMPVWLLRSPDFHALRRRSPLALRVLLCLWAHGRGVGSLCFPGERRLAALCKTSVPSISLAIKLITMGCSRRPHRGVPPSCRDAAALKTPRDRSCCHPALHRSG